MPGQGIADEFLAAWRQLLPGDCRDQPVPGLRGAYQRIERSSSSVLDLLSIQPKQSASSTVSTYSTRGLPVAFL